jgi:alkylmercury lyase
MTAETAKAGACVDAIDSALAAATPSLSDREQRLAVAVLRLLAAGHPVSLAAAAEAAATLTAAEAESVLRSWPAVFWEDHDQVVGFWGLALGRMPPHRVQRAGVELYAWCAFDPLYLARIIGGLEVATADAITGEAIIYRVGRDGAITGASHPDAMLSFLRPDGRWGDDVQTTFCHYVHHFTGPGTARRWTAGTSKRLRDQRRRGGRAGPPSRCPRWRRHGVGVTPGAFCCLGSRAPVARVVTAPARREG